MAFTDCEQINNMFIQAPEYIVPELLYEKFKPTNAWYGIVDEEEFVSNHGTTHTGKRLSRMTMPNPADDDWRKIEVDVCATNACDFDPKIIQHGSDSYNWSIVQRDLRTDWYCLDGLQWEYFPEQEMSNIQANLNLMNTQVQEEFIRHRYLASVAPNNKWLMLGDASDPCATQCLSPQREAWFFETVTESGEPSPRFIRVGVSVANLSNIALLNNDMLNFALYERQYILNDMGWIQDMSGLYPLYLDSPITSNRLVQSADAAANFIVSLGGNSIPGINGQSINNRLGLIQRTTANFMHKIDPYAMKFYPDTAFNEGLAAFDIADTSTWPRLFRVFPYLKEGATIGIRSILDPAYINAPFTISSIFHPEVGAVQRPRPSRGYGSAVNEAPPDAQFEWNNPPWQCNVKRSKGFFMGSWRMAWRPKFTEYGYAFLHRTENAIRYADVNACALPSVPYCPSEVLAYCCVTSTGLAPCADDAGGQNRVQDTTYNITPTINS